MGYSTELFGKLKFDRQLTADEKKKLEDFAEERHGGYMSPFPGLPGFWCQWIPTEDGLGLEWDGNEKFYYYTEWLEYLIKNFFIPWGITLNGTVEWAGEDYDDRGRITVIDNVVTVDEGVVVYLSTTKEVDNHAVWSAINEALKTLGLTHEIGGDSMEGLEDTYTKGDYKVTIGIKN